MIPEKSLAIPRVGRRTVRVTPAYLKAHGAHVRLFQLREENGQYVMAENFVTAGYLGVETCALVAANGLVYGSTETGITTECRNGDAVKGFSAPVCGALTYSEEGGATVVYLYNGNAVVCVSGASSRPLSAPKGASAAAFFHERTFYAKGNVLYYSALLDAENFDAEKEGTGRIELPAPAGDVVALVPYGNRLLIFRKYDILRLRADGDDLNFQILHLDFRAGEILPGSVQRCGKHVVFCTPRGLCVLCGESCNLVRPASSEEDLGDPVMTASHGGRYYAFVRLPEEGKCLFIFDPATGEEYFLPAKANLLAADETNVWLCYLGRLMRMSGRGLGVAAEGLLRFEIDLGAPHTVEKVAVRGLGNFRIELVASEGSFEAELSAGETKSLGRVLHCDHVRVALHVPEAESRIDAIELFCREDHV